MDVTKLGMLEGKEGGGKETRKQERKGGKWAEERVVDNVTRLGD